ncbi:hypothetical protein HS048_31300 [Planomonospora sp. ID91781]|uniref:hypothetical protein n=1 Tax=Planomonospora sp. ID91781 TaxID=2738135 RepID=UPI0018C4024E|nr:hypothetical protein [Planomonospora sp. ID91781]MBG0825180.1 hypothetical protein [Planomonospora sp. ID91781]
METYDLRVWSGQLVELAWELNELGFDSVVRLPPGGRPSMEIFLPAGRPWASTAQHGHVSVFTWERGRPRKVRTWRSQTSHGRERDRDLDPDRRNRDQQSRAPDGRTAWSAALRDGGAMRAVAERILEVAR